MCDPLLVDWPWGPMASLLRDKDIQEKLPSRKTNLRKIIDSTERNNNRRCLRCYGVGNSKLFKVLK